MSAPRIQHREPSSIDPGALRLRSGPIAHDRYRIAYRFGEDGPEGEIVQPTQAEAWATWRVVLAAHERTAA